MHLRVRLVWLTAAVLTAAAALPAAAGADQTSSCQPGHAPAEADPSTAGGVNIHLTANNSVVWCPAAVIEANSDIAPGVDYQLRATAESPGTNPVINAISINHLLTIAGVDPSTVSFTHVLRGNGTWSTLDAADLSTQPPTFQGGLKPIVWIDGDGETDYLRPLRGPTDTNADDHIIAVNGAPIDLYVSSGPLLTVIASAKPTKVATGQAVSFAARVTNYAAADGALTYDWTFQDGPTATAASPKHAFDSTGSYDVTVTVYGHGNDSGGASQPVTVIVGKPPVGADHGTPAGNGNGRDRRTGPTDSGGSTLGASPTHKRSSGAGVTPSSSHDQTAGRSGTSSQGTTSPQSSTTPAQTTSTAAAPTPHQGAHKHHAAAAGRRRSAATKRVKPEPSPATTVVRGRLIADLIPVSAVQVAQQNLALARPRSQAHAPSASLGGGSVAPIADVAGGCVIMLLLGLGAGLELRSQSRPVAPARAG
jgi:hypothetical protein